MAINLQQKFYVFGARNVKTAAGYQINFLNLPNIQAKGVTFAETQYYSYRVLSFFLRNAQKTTNLEQLTLHTIANLNRGPNEFFSLTYVTTDLDPHKMQTDIMLPAAEKPLIQSESRQLVAFFTPNLEDEANQAQ